jgi:hypothetical protein
MLSVKSKVMDTFENNFVPDRLASLHERFSTAVATYQGIMNSYALQRQQQQTFHFGHQGAQQYSHYSQQQF